LKLPKYRRYWSSSRSRTFMPLMSAAANGSYPVNLIRSAGVAWCGIGEPFHVWPSGLVKTAGLFKPSLSG
jgi:hypothetical protein